MTLKMAVLLMSFFPIPLQTAMKVEMEVTAYCRCKSCCGECSDGITASGHRLRQSDKVIAAPKAFRFGSKIYVPGYGLASVEDRGGAIKGNRLDVYFSSHQEALQWGRQKLTITIFGG